jgi:hypothetical protein
MIEVISVTIFAESRPSDTEMERSLLRAITRVIHLDENGDAADPAANVPSLSLQRDVGRISVSVRCGTARLSGTVRSWAEGQVVVEAARAVPGVRAIDNRLRINPNI